MTDLTEEVIVADFDVSEWEPTPYQVEGTNSELSTVRAVKIFEGDITGTSVADLIMAGNTVGAGYVGSEVFAGTVAGRTGTMVIQHWGLAEGTATASSGHIIPGSGTDGLAGISGKAIYTQEEDGQHRLELRVTFPEIQA
ncbi:MULTISPECIES: DUF3224 domain-containing protein [unclassified Arthrobacter]|uniref:DUF3224 domain-containing protein n=1 Tax=unclassified Arthrobacter TaxID=235627 RepID=UPI001D156BD9|nr:MULTISPECIES: DUF3224 domain-containing protein [unclassified Arthrobacter]MCC3275035.1 DUF3224 domain-containing protein [Arthrobacter sp. zg-Y20]MCC3278993.1 DUF3224 domain-containing protein [Arthrobacter sp. zg-Y40]MCC9177368.1 DUF3224 domain-containing protein [Arthrobacter sp. zg-Y750]MDK1315192.1 DUF3224 domain-containing protein [Arthrobacter sp. zg.Y20]MDK1328053.1 DUF3224 domain-containing protein [Arthrobacter sp. zg-Y1143]